MQLFKKPGFGLAFFIDGFINTKCQKTLQLTPPSFWWWVTSLPDLEAAKAMAHALVESNLAACVQLMSGIQSIYRWEGKICEEQEVLLLAKTTAVKWLEISIFIQSAHPYDLPEILAYSPEQYEKQYGKWVESEVHSKT